MLSVGLILSVLVASSYGLIACTPNICDGVDKGVLECEGDRIDGGGFCGCTDTCAGMEGDSCSAPADNVIPILGASPIPPCSSGLECVKKSMGSSLIFGFGRNGVCQKMQAPTPAATKRPPTQCERTRMLRWLSNAIWAGQWTPRCYTTGEFMPKQCDNTERPQSQCEQTRAVRMISFAIWRGQWTPNCYANGDFKPKQCDNTGACFCVTAQTGEMIVGSKKQSQDVMC